MQAREKVLQEGCIGAASQGRRLLTAAAIARPIDRRIILPDLTFERLCAMPRRYYELPSLTSLAAFEASARHLSFKRAAHELNVTPGAVSRQIKALEADIGLPLFQRVHRGVVLTTDGTKLYTILAQSFSQIAQAYQDVRNKERRAEVTIGATTAFASLWLMPRLGEFSRAHREITLNHVIADRAHDLRLSAVDLRVRYGKGVWPDERAVKLFDDRIYPVCGRDFAEAHRETADLQTITELPLLILDGVDPEWTDWTEWLQRLGQSASTRDTRRFNNYFIALQAAQDNQGVVLGWNSMVKPLLDAGKLVRLTDLEVAAPGSFYVTTNANRNLTTHGQILLDWLVETAQQPTGQLAKTADSLAVSLLD
ncbi:LysR substrate-binding domain-containing protein [Pelagibius sp. Alg239-R121]|uniref:LysR substrate-binding domain-containing protein n=1 Tax=Pelagibius sp. Alg239-R121 TaxID=2993448 RepID=UPI0024A70DCD|nr:LysR substrate-binding domain-containing protein [Pelagibius sp. Alg239-R121]